MMWSDHYEEMFPFFGIKEPRHITYFPLLQVAHEEQSIILVEC
jgi:hypothetical protein